MSEASSQTAPANVHVSTSELLDVRQVFLRGCSIANLTGIERPPVHVDPFWMVRLVDEVLVRRGIDPTEWFYNAPDTL